MDDVERIFTALHPKVSFAGRVGTANFVPQPEHRGNVGWLHGGLAATVLDHVCARTAAAALGGRVVTGTLDLRYRRPVSLDGGPYLVRAESQEPRRRTVRVTGAICEPDGRPLIEASSLFVAAPDAMRA